MGGDHLLRITILLLERRGNAEYDTPFWKLRKHSSICYEPMPIYTGHFKRSLEIAVGPNGAWKPGQRHHA